MKKQSFWCYIFGVAIVVSYFCLQITPAQAGTGFFQTMSREIDRASKKLSRNAEVKMNCAMSGGRYYEKGDFESYIKRNGTLRLTVPRGYCKKK